MCAHSKVRLMTGRVANWVCSFYKNGQDFQISQKRPDCLFRSNWTYVRGSIEFRWQNELIVNKEATNTLMIESNADTCNVVSMGLCISITHWFSHCFVPLISTHSFDFHLQIYSITIFSVNFIISVRLSVCFFPRSCVSLCRGATFQV